MLTRRSILFGLIAAPVVVRAGLIMPVRPPEAYDPLLDYAPIDLSPGGVNWLPMHGEWRGSYWEWRAEGSTAFLRRVPESSNKPLAHPLEF
jgi:hypothetical protein